MQIILTLISPVIIVAFIAFCYLFYPWQCMPIGEPIEVKTIEPEKYHNDCLHPCIRYNTNIRKYYMAQSPYYGWNNRMENPMFYESDDYRVWHDGELIADTPKKGYNSDPCIYIDAHNQITYLWRECHTSLCDSHNSKEVTVGGILHNGKLVEKKTYVINNLCNGDIEQCPILIEHKGVFYIYAVWYQYEPIRKNIGIAIWKGTSLVNPNFELQDTIPFESCYTVDKMVNIPISSHIFYFPKPLKHDLWHFDLFEYAGRLYMVSVAEKGDNIMLSVAEDWKHFKTFRKPLVNNHYTENYCGYRQYYYKPTAFVKGDTLHLFYTANAKDDPKRNQLYHTAASIKSIIK